jgi:hypothetical protein
MTLTLLFFLTNSAFAGTEFAGTWAGEGSASNQIGLVYPGCEIGMQINQTDTQFSIQQGSYICNGLSGRMDALNVEIIGNELFFGNQKVGNLESDHINLRHVTQSFDTYYDLTIDNGAIVFQETQFDAAQPENYVNVTGLLIHQ